MRPGWRSRLRGSKPRATSSWPGTIATTRRALLEIGDPPPVFYCLGRRELLTCPALAIVGSRNATPQGASDAHAFARALSAAGLTIVSGLALGIDAAAHGARSKARGAASPSSGTGLDRVYPAANRDLAHDLAARGLLLSEFAPGTPPLPQNFPRRNRVVSGLARGVLVVEATLSSGSLITARLAGEQGREVFALPGSIHSPFSKGCHKLMREGAKLVETAQDVLDELRLPRGDAVATTAAATSADDELTADERAVVASLGHAPCRGRRARGAHRTSARSSGGSASRAGARRPRDAASGRALATRATEAPRARPQERGNVRRLTSALACVAGARAQARALGRLDPTFSCSSRCDLCTICRSSRPPPMSKSLIIAEKPSVAADIARALGGFTRHDDYFESDRHVLSSAVGHLLEIGMPEEEEVKRGKWTFAHLPAIPPHFELKPIEKNENRLKTLLKLIKRKDVTALINACDAGREGELIFRNIVQYAKAGKPIERLWLQSMTPAAIRDGFERVAQRRRDAPARRRRGLPLRGGLARRHQRHARDDGVQLEVGRLPADDGGPRADADARDPGRARGEDPRVRAAQLLGGPRHVRARAAANTRAAGSTRHGRRTTTIPTRAPSGCGTRRARGALVAKCAGKPGIVTEESKPTTQGAPLLYDLTSLQREANGRFGLSARTTLSLAQALYEKHKVLTYPRTDSRALPEDYLATVKATMEELGANQRVRRLRAPGPEAEMGAAQQAHLRQREDLRSLRDHPDARRSRST